MRNAVKRYPDIELKWKETGLSFQVQFAKKDFQPITANEAGSNGGNIGGDGGNQELQNRIIKLITNDNQITVQNIADNLNISKRNCERIIADLKQKGLLIRKGSARAGYWVVDVTK